MRGGVQVAAGVVGGLPRFGDDGDAGNAERVDAHRLRFVARGHRRAAARKAHDAAADCAQKDGLYCRPELAGKFFPVDLQFHFGCFLVLV